MPNGLSPERLYLKQPFNLHDENTVKHVARYRFASDFVRGNILDCACGSGYGSKMLSVHGRVTGVDRSIEAIHFARINNSSPKIRYICEDIKKLKCKKMFDAIVCIETFEHIETESAIDLLHKFAAWIKKGGTVVVSTPMLRYKDGKPYITNPHHINELPRKNLIYNFNDAFDGFTRHFFHQDMDTFNPLGTEDTGFMIMVAKHGSK